MAMSLYRGGSGPVIAIGEGSRVPWSSRDDPFLTGGDASSAMTISASADNQINVLELRRIMRTRDDTKRQSYLAALDRCQKDWCKITVGRLTGWTPAAALWGSDDALQCR